MVFTYLPLEQTTRQKKVSNRTGKLAWTSYRPTARAIRRRSMVTVCILLHCSGIFYRRSQVEQVSERTSWVLRRLPRQLQSARLVFQRQIRMRLLTLASLLNDIVLMCRLPTYRAGLTKTFQH